MTRIDYVILRRFLGSIGLTLAVFFGIASLLESLNVSRFNALSAVGGPLMALLAIGAAAARAMLDALPFLVLVGAIIGLLNLQSTREMTVIKASGVSVWRAMRAPLIAVLIGGLVIAVGADTAVVTLTRNLSPTALSGNSGKTAPLWIEERGTPHYILEADYADPGGEALSGVVIFMLDQPRVRIVAPSAQLVGAEWQMAKATRYRSNEVAETVTDLRVPTKTTGADMRAKLASVHDLTIFQLASAIASHLTEPVERAQTLTRLAKLLALPFTLTGSVVIAFAFTAGYRRTNKYGGAVLYGIVLGFVVYVVAEMASRAAFAGAMQPAVAVLGPTLLAIVAGVTVLLNREDGRT